MSRVVDGVPEHTKVPQVGNVIIQDDVEIGSNVSIDRGTLADVSETSAPWSRLAAVYDAVRGAARTAFAAGREDPPGVLPVPREHPGVRRAHREQVELECGDDTEPATTSACRPEQVAVDRVGRPDERSVGQDQLDIDAENAPRLEEGDSMKLLQVEEWTSQTVRFTTAAQVRVGETRLKMETGGDLRTRRIQGFASYHRLTGEPQVIHSRGDIRDERRTEGGAFVDSRLSHGGFQLAAGARTARHSDFPEPVGWRLLHRLGPHGVLLDGERE